MKSLMVILNDRISDWISKGEITRRYFNPGGLFQKVHLLLLNNESPDPEALRKLVGNVEFSIHCFPTGISHFIRTAGWNPILLKLWVKPMVELAKKLNPSLIRCYGAVLNAFAAHQIKSELGIPYIISLHINPEIDIRGRELGFLKRVRDKAYSQFEKRVLREADLVLPVYQPIVPYLQSLGVSRYEVAYNVLNPDHLGSKTNYQLHSPIKIISVGRQFREKNPHNLVRAVAEIPNVHLTLVGDGTYHERLKTLVRDLQLESRVEFLRSVANDELCRLLPDCDIFATHSEYFEISKSILESFLTGLPTLINRRNGLPVPELTNDICILVEDSATGYRQGLNQLIFNDSFRKQLGETAYKTSRERWSPVKTENNFANIYERFLQNSSTGPDLLC